TEGVVLATIGGAIGVGLSVAAVQASRKLLAERLPRMDELAVDWRVLATAAGFTLLTAILCALGPAFRGTRDRSGEVLRGGALGSVGLRSESRMRGALVVVQFSLAMVLLV